MSTTITPTLLHKDASGQLGLLSIVHAGFLKITGFFVFFFKVTKT